MRLALALEPPTVVRSDRGLLPHGVELEHTDDLPEPLQLGVADAAVLHLARREERTELGAFVLVLVHDGVGEDACELAGESVLRSIPNVAFMGAIAGTVLAAASGPTRASRTGSSPR